MEFYKNNLIFQEKKLWLIKVIIKNNFNRIYLETVWYGIVQHQKIIHKWIFWNNKKKNNYLRKKKKKIVLL
jgi:hypothetical protein